MPSTTYRGFGIRICPNNATHLSNDTRPLTYYGRLPNPSVRVLRINVRHFLPIPVDRPSVITMDNSASNNNRRTIRYHGSQYALLTNGIRTPIRNFFPNGKVLPPTVEIESAPHHHFRQRTRHLPQLYLFRTNSHQSVFTHASQRRSTHRRGSRRRHRDRRHHPLVSLIFPYSSVFYLRLFTLHSKGYVRGRSR